MGRPAERAAFFRGGDGVARRRGWIGPVPSSVGMSRRAAPWHGCDTCAKFDAASLCCAVLIELIGARGQCWAWDDDLMWEYWVEVATARYAAQKGEPYRAEVMD